jgi:glycosyltransferase involved in cell wall biosynthesis
MLKALQKLRDVVRDWRPDVIHAHMMTSALLARPICSLAGVPLVTSVHNEFEKSAILMAVGDRVIAVSDAVGQAMLRRGVAKRQLRVVLNGTIGAARLANAASTAPAFARPAILFVAGLHPRKGLPDLLEAFDAVHARFPEARLYVVGGGPFRERYEELARARRSAAAISFLGPQPNPIPFMRNADIFVLPSHAEPAGLVLSEAREAGCAVIASNVGGIPEMLERGEAGLLVPPRDPAALAQALSALLSDPAELRKWRERSQINLAHMHVERVAAETLAVYTDALSAKRRSALALSG